MPESSVEVVVQIAGADVLAGRLWAHRRRNAESQTFAYVPDYVARPDAYALDPALPLVVGQQQTPAGRAIFGAFSDCAPDRWGRRLIARAERQRARAVEQAARSFGEVDYLLGVRDDQRQGALRFRGVGSETYLAPEISGIPHLIELPRLLSAADHLERDEASEDELRILLRGGSSLGGARPKAHVRLDPGRVAIAKFPSPSSDEWDVMRWEAVALELARRAGIIVPFSRLHEIDGTWVLILDRFDRHDDSRIGYVSAMTMLEAADGDGGSYLEIAEVIEAESPTARADLEQLWRRVAFSILISNFDDHLRNHGFLRMSTAGWSLSPAFDLNPDPRPGERHLSTAIALDDTEARLDTLLEVADYFRLGPERSQAVVAQVSAATDQWRSAAGRVGLGERAMVEMEPAFEHAEARRARGLVAA